MAAIAAAYTLRARNPEELRAIREQWFLLRDLASLTKSLLYATVLFDDPPIRNQAVLCFALVIAIEQDNWADSLVAVHEQLAIGLGDPEKAIGLLSIFKELLWLDCFPELRTPKLLRGCELLWIQSLELLS
jgi:hypothetical protein